MQGAKKFLSHNKTNFLLVAISLFPVIVLYIPFILRFTSFWGIPFENTGLHVIFANWDGPNYVYNAITNYGPQSIADKQFLNAPKYYPAHFPGLSWIISIFSLVFGFYYSSFVVQIMSGVILNFTFYHFMKSKSKYALWLTFAFTVFPPRYFILRAILGPELILTTLVIMSFAFWDKGKYLLAGLFSLFAVLMKFQALTIAVTFGVLAVLDFIRHKRPNFNMIFATIMGIVGYCVVALYFMIFSGDFNAYFEGQKIAGMSAQLPFMMFNYSQKWVGTGWMEAPAIYFIALFAVSTKLFQIKKYAYAIFVVVYTAMLSLIPQVDIMRLAYPVAPFFYYAFADKMSTKTTKIALILSIPVIYLFALNFIITNQAPITDWSLFK